jgi:hypothetical protein
VLELLVLMSAPTPVMQPIKNFQFLITPRTEKSVCACPYY